ncbi:MAG: SDR family NAD(P)-dependent oxidoreductase, partial [Oscillospiraceae bacterium]|nr:SDR family NAD(P)-dependent oxidoreductase [Oscillospiraceae bacterium]
MNRLNEKVIIVTGSTSGIGVGIARLCAAEGATVIICGRREAKGQAIVDQIISEGGKAAYHYMDVTVPESVEALMADTYNTYGRIDALVNNAANVGLADGRVDEVSLDMWDAVFESDLRSTFYATKCALPYMTKDGVGGSIVNIGSMASCGGDLGSAAYASAKAGVDMLTKTVSLQYGKQNVRCNCIR